MFFDSRVLVTKCLLQTRMVGEGKAVGSQKRAHPGMMLPRIRYIEGKGIRGLKEHLGDFLMSQYIYLMEMNTGKVNGSTAEKRRAL